MESQRRLNWTTKRRRRKVKRMESLWYKKQVESFLEAASAWKVNEWFRLTCWNGVQLVEFGYYRRHFIFISQKVHIRYLWILKDQKLLTPWVFVFGMKLCFIVFAVVNMCCMVICTRVWGIFDVFYFTFPRKLCRYAFTLTKENRWCLGLCREF